MRALEVCAGIGGLTLALEMAGFETAGIALASPWSDATPILCRDGKWRLVPAELEVQRVADRTAEGLASRSPLAPSEPGRVARLRALGNAVCPRQAYVPARALYEELSR